MLPSESPFPCQWWGIGLEDAGLGDVRPDTGTYGRYDFHRLPALPFVMKGDFAWLETAPEHEESSIGEMESTRNLEALASLQAFSKQRGIQLSETFVHFMGALKLQKRIRSNTDCFLDLCPEAVPSPVGEGFLIRFLADSQGCLFWYLYLTPDGSDHAVVCSFRFYGTETEMEQWEDDFSGAATIVYCAESFEAFMCRFWLENEIWFSAAWEKTPLSEAGQKYIDLYKGS